MVHVCGLGMAAMPRTHTFRGTSLGHDAVGDLLPAAYCHARGYATVSFGFERLSEGCLLGATPHTGRPLVRSWSV